jgi:ATP-binding cassette subfamily C protein CydD
MEDVQRWLSRQAPLAGNAIGAAAGLGVSGGLLVALQAALLVRVADGVIFRQEALGDLSLPLFLLLGALAARALLAWASERAAFTAASRVKLEVRDRLYARIQALGPVFLYGEKSGEMAETLFDGVEALGDYYARYLPQRAVAAVLPLVMLAFIYPLDWIAGVVMTVTAAAIPALMFVVAGVAQGVSNRQWRKLAQMSARFLDSVQGLGTLKLLGAARRELHVIAGLSEEYRRSSMAVMQMAFVSALILELFSTVSIAMVAISIGVRLMQGSMAFQPGYFILLLAPEYYLPLRALGSYYHRRIAAISAAERIVQILHTPVPERAGGLRSLPGGEGVSVRFEGVRFGYAPDRPVLEEISFEVAPGEKVALVGQSGAGKSTIVSLLLGFVRPESGCVRVNGVDLWALEHEEWLRHVIWMPQRPHLFHGTVLDNIRLGSPDASWGQVLEAARRAHADAFIRELPQGYETRLGEGGAGLSGGQLQRIALSRAFLKDAPLVILDEAAANLDSESEALLEQGIEQLVQGRSLLAVAHRLGAAQRADRVLVLHGGRIIQAGSHTALLRQPGPYRRMARALQGAR